MMVYLFSKSEENYQVLNNNEDEEVGECKKLLMDAESDQEVEYNPGDKIVEFAQKTSYILLTGLLLMTGFPLVLPPIFAR